MNLPNRQRLLMIIAVIAIAFLAGDRLVLTPLGKSWTESSTRIAELRKQITQGTVLLEREQTIRQRWAQMRTNALSREVSLAEGQLLNAFDRWSKDSGVSVSSIRPQWKRGAEDYMTLECRADAFGDLSSLTRFLYLIDNDALGVKVDTIELSSRDARGQQLNLVLQVSGLMLQPPGS